MASQRSFPLPGGWTHHVKSGLLHAISLAAMALTIARSRRARSRLETELDRADGEIALLKEELAIKDARWGRVPPRRRPHFTPIHRMRILQVKAARGWSYEQAAGAFMIDEQTLRSWCRRRAIHPRFGAVGKQGSIATIERFIRSMKNECARQILIPLRLEAMGRELGFYVTWYNDHRRSQALGGWTPWDVYAGIRPANVGPRFEPRRNRPATGPCASPQTAIRGRRGTKLTLVVGYVDGRRYLPVVELRKAA